MPRRHSGLGRYISLAVGALAAAVDLAPAPCDAGTLRVTLGPIACPRLDAIAREIESRSEPHLGSYPDLALEARADAPGYLRLVLSGLDGASYERILRFRAPEDCPALALTLALLLRSWLSRELLAQAQEEAAAAIAGRRLVVPESAPAPPPPAPSPPPFRWLRLSLTGGAFGDLGPGGTGWTASLAVEAELAPSWGLDLVASRAGKVTARYEPGWVSFDAWSVGLRARTSLVRGPSHLELLAGPALHVLQVTTGHFALNFAPRVPDLLLAAALRARVPLTSRLQWLFVAELGLRAHAERLDVEGAPPLEITPARFAAQTGIAWEVP